MRVTYGNVDQAETRSASLADNDVLWPEELADARPEPAVGDDVVRLDRYLAGKWRDGEFFRAFLELLECLGKLGQEVLHPDAGVTGVLDLGVVGVQLRETISAWVRWTR